MNGRQLDNILSRLISPNKCSYLGIFSQDHLPSPSSNTHSFPLCFVANTDPSNKPGEHWVSFFYDSPSSLEFFDSYGLDPSFYGFNIIPSHINHTTLQALGSTVCGHYCIFYLYHRTQGLSLTRILCSFSTVDLDWNDKHVAHFVSKHFSLSSCSCLLLSLCQCCVTRKICTQCHHKK